MAIRESWRRNWLMRVMCGSLIAMTLFAATPAEAQLRPATGERANRLAQVPAKRPARTEPDAESGAGHGVATPRGTRHRLERREVYQTMLKSSGWIVAHVDGSAGRRTVSRGSGWVLDTQRRLMVTNYHVIADKGEMAVFFPAYKDGELVTDESFYFKAVKPIRAKIIDTNQNQDLALLQLESLPAGIVALPLASRSVGAADTVHMLGGNPGIPSTSGGASGVWMYATSIVRQVSKQPSVVTRNRQDRIWTVQTHGASFWGHSGGAVANDYAEVVAVVHGGYGLLGARMGQHIDLREIRAFLKDSLPLVDPQTPELLTRRGFRRLDASKRISGFRNPRDFIEQAQDDFNAAIRLDSKHAAAYAGRGTVFLRNGDHQTALLDFDDATRLNPALVEAHEGRGKVHYAMGKHKEAVSDFSRAIRFDSKSWSLYFGRGKSQFQLKQYGIAADDFGRAIGFNLTNDELHGWRGDALRLGRRYTEAARSYSSAIVIADYWVKRVAQQNSKVPSWLTELAGRYMLKRGICFYYLRKYESAAADFQSAAFKRPRDFSAQGWLGNGLQKLNRHADAIRAFTRALTLNARSDINYYFRGISKRKLRRFTDAISDFDRAIGIKSTDGYYFYERGVAYKALGQTAQAGRDFRTAASLNPKRFGQLANAGAAGGGTSPPAFTPVIDRRAPAGAAFDTALVGTWKYEGKIDSVTVRMIAVLNRDGSYSYNEWEWNGSAWRHSESETGRFTSTGSVLTFDGSKGRTDLKYSFRNSYLYVEFKYNGFLYNVPFKKS